MALLGEIDLTGVVRMFPSLAFFDKMVLNATAGMLQQMIAQGLTPKEFQTEVDTVGFAITLAGSVYSMVNNNPEWGFTDHEYMETLDG